MAAGWWNDYSYECEECDYSVSPRNERMIRVCWVFWISKHIEFFDTVRSASVRYCPQIPVSQTRHRFIFQYFFILKKKWHQVSTLHVVHHTLMAFTWWFGVKFSPGGLGTFHAMVNSLVHTVMYFYYGISALGPEYRRYIWWKKYLTTFQMVCYPFCYFFLTCVILDAVCGCGWTHVKYHHPISKLHISNCIQDYYRMLWYSLLLPLRWFL